MIVKDWWYALRVCMKYRVWWWPFVAEGDGWYKYLGIVGVSPFTKNFMSIFLHEIGHHVHNKRVGLRDYQKATGDDLRFTSGHLEGRNIFRVLDAEATASRFAVKTGKADKQYLVQCFNTYTALIFKKMHVPVVQSQFSAIVDSTYKNTRRILK